MFNIGWVNLRSLGNIISKSSSSLNVFILFCIIQNCAMFDIAGVTSVKTRGFLLFNQSVWRLKSSKNIPSAGLGWTGRGGPQKGGCRLAVAL